MAWAFVAADHYDSSASTSGVVTKPSGTADNDILFAYIKHNANELPNTVPSGFANLGSFWEAGGSAHHSLYWKLAASEGANYTWGWATSARSGVTMVAFRDAFDTADPIDVVSNTSYVTSNTTVRAAGMTVAAANSPIIYFGGAHSSSAQTFTPPTNPTTLTEHVDRDGATTGGSRFIREIASAVWTGSGASGDIDGTFSATTTTKHAFAVALNPAASGGATATPGVGAVSVAGQIPSLLKDLSLSPTHGLVSVVGQAPSLLLERTIVPDQGLGTAVTQPASTVGVLALDSAVGLVTAQGLAPALSLEQSVTPAAGLVIVEGRAPELLGDGVVLGTAEPITGAVSVQGLVPTFVTETLDETRGHARRRRTARRARIVEEPSSGPVQAIVLAPDVPAYFDPPTNRLAGFNTLADALEVRLTEIEQRRAAIARRRREEEEIVRFLLRVA